MFQRISVGLLSIFPYLIPLPSLGSGYEYISELMIQNVEKDDFTSYGCEAANQMGYDYVRINLEQLGNQINAILAPALTLWYKSETLNEKLCVISIAFLS